MHRVVVVANDGVVPFDLSVPIEVFGRARLADGRPAYQVQVCAVTEEVRAGAVGVRVPHDLSVLAEADTVVVPGTADLGATLPAAIREALATSTARLVSICTGAFVLAAAGRLDGRRPPPTGPPRPSWPAGIPPSRSTRTCCSSTMIRC